MPCPKCGCVDSYVIDSRQNTELIKRRRKCCHCRNRYNTVEINADEYEKMKKQEYIAQKFIDLAKEVV